MDESKSPRKAVKLPRSETKGENATMSKHLKEAAVSKDCVKPNNGNGENKPQPGVEARDASSQSSHGGGKVPGGSAVDQGRGKARRLTGRNSPGERGKGKVGRPQLSDTQQPLQDNEARLVVAVAAPTVSRPAHVRDSTATTACHKASVDHLPSSEEERMKTKVTSVKKDLPGPSSKNICIVDFLSFCQCLTDISLYLFRRQLWAISDKTGVGCTFAGEEVKPMAGLETVIDETSLTTEQQLGLQQAEERLVRDYIHRLIKRSPDYPNFQYLCKLCSVHIENIQGAHKHIKEKRHKKNIMEKQEENELRALPPASPAQLQALGAAVADVVCQQGISEEDFLVRQAVVHRMEKVIQKHLSVCSLRLYGSCLTRFAFKTSDVNIDVTYPSNVTLYTDVESDFHAKVPVVFCKDVSSGLMCKVSAGNDVACLTTNLLAALAKLEPRLIPLVLAFRYWAKLCHIDCQAEGGIPSYSFSLMVVFFLQQRKTPILPVYLGPWIEGFDVKQVDEYHLTGVFLGKMVAWEHKPPSSVEGRGEGKAKTELKKPIGKKEESRDANTSNSKVSSGMSQLTLDSVQDVPLGQLWLELLRFYTLEFALEEHIISIRLRELLSREVKNWPRRRLAIEDPFALKRNVARSLNSQMVFEYIQERFRTAYKYFACPQSKNGLTKGNRQNKSGKPVGKGDERARAETPAKARGLARERSNCRETEQRSQRVDDGEDDSEDEDDEGASEDDDGPEGVLSADLNDLLLSEGEESPAQQVWLADQASPPQNGLLESEEEERLPLKEVVEVSPDDLYYTFDRMTFTGGKPPTVVCGICKRDGHLKDECPEDFKKIELKPLPPMTDHFRDILDGLCRLCYDELSPPPVEQQKREQILASLERFIRKEYNEKARLCLFGSSKNGFGFRDSDLDICMTLEGHDTAEKLNCKEIIEGLAKVLKKHAGLRNILPITTAKVPIVKFEHKQSGLEGDISLYNTLAQHNTRMLATYAAIDPRVQYLGYTMKVFAKRCDIGDASRGSLSSYAYILMVLYFLQQRQPPVIPVLQEIFDGKTVPQRMVDGWNAFFFDDIEELRRRLPELGQNNETVGELWLGLLRFYTEEFDFKEHVISIRQRKRLTTFEKQWTSKCIAIEDPFDLSHNLGAGVSRKMTNFIMKAFINGRKLFGTPFYPQPGVEAEYFFDSKVLTDGELAPNDRCCRICGKIGHYMKDCPKRRRMKKKENDKEDEMKEEEREPRERRCFQCRDTGHVRRDCPEYRQLRQRSPAVPALQTSLVTLVMLILLSLFPFQSDTRQTPPYSPQSTPFSQGSAASPSSPQSHVKAPGTQKQSTHPQVPLSLFNLPHSHPGPYHHGLSALGVLQSHQQQHHHHSVPIPSTSWPIHGPVIQTTSTGGPANGSGPVGLNDPSIIFAQPAVRPLPLSGAGREGHWHNPLGPGALVGNGTLGKSGTHWYGWQVALNPPTGSLSWEHGSAAQYSLSPSWPYHMPQAFVHQGNGGFHQGKPFISQGWNSRNCVFLLLRERCL
uniref:RNA uridylyltransferase n=1 Tax=Scleropages formosus TaxID=113540 RepID=A0A8C9VXW6_SCLFO